MMWQRDMIISVSFEQLSKLRTNHLTHPLAAGVMSVIWRRER
ncbi:hypothetical protein A2U01_0117911, partial [Trifolium medium]|nr:hypothetical protein [Trifolium medium]